jgi:predicted transcriptional regulator
VKIIIDLDPKLQRKLEVLANGRGRTVSDVIGEILNKVMTRDGSASSSSSEGIPSPAMVEAAKKAAVNAPGAPASTAVEDLVFLLEPLVARFRLADADGRERRALLAEMAMLPQDPAVVRLVGLLKQSLS